VAGLDGGSLYHAIHPVKLEVLNMDPDVIMIHDFVLDSEIDEIVRASGKRVRKIPMPLSKR
jgi:hypothetical protein